MIISLILAGSLVADPINFVGPLSDLLREVRRSADASLSIDPVLGRRIVCLRAEPEDVGVALKALSRSIGAELVKNSDGFSLKLSQAQSELQAKEERLEREERIAKYLQSSGRQAKMTAQDIANEIVELRTQNAAHLAPTAAKALHLKLLSAIGPRNLASIPHFSSQTRSDKPTLVEHSLPAEAQVHLNEYKARVQELKKIAKTWDPNSFGPTTYEFVVRPILEFEKIGKVHLGTAIVGNSVFSVLRIFDTDGKRVDYNSLSIGFDWKTDSAFIGCDDQVSLEPNLQNLLEETADPFRAPKEREAELLELMKSEPHALVTQPLLKQLAEHENASIAVELTDRAFRDLANNPPKTTRELCLSLAGSGISLELKDGWLTSRFTLASIGHEMGLERRSWRKWLGVANSTGHEWLRAEALLAAENGSGFSWSPLDNWVRDRVLRPLREELVPDEIFPLPILQALGNFNEVEWNNLVSGRDVRANPGTSAAERLLSFSYDTFALEAVPGRRPLADIEKTGTVSLQHGMPLGSIMRLSRLSENAWKAPEFGPLPRTFSDLGNRIGSEIQSFGLPEVSARMRSKGVLGRLFFDQVTILYGTDLMYKFGDYATEFAATGELTSFDEWSEEIRNSFMKDVKRQFDQMAKQAATRPPE